MRNTPRGPGSTVHTPQSFALEPDEACGSAMAAMNCVGIRWKPGGAAIARAAFVRSASDVEMRKERLSCLPTGLLLFLEGGSSGGSGVWFLAPDKVGIVEIRPLLVMHNVEGEKE